MGTRTTILTVGWIGICLIAAAARAPAQTGTIRIETADERGNPVDRAAFRARDDEGAEGGFALTGPDGLASLDLPVGPWNWKAERLGFQAVEGALDLEALEEALLEITLPDVREGLIVPIDSLDESVARIAVSGADSLGNVRFVGANASRDEVVLGLVDDELRLSVNQRVTQRGAASVDIDESGDTVLVYSRVDNLLQEYEFLVDLDTWSESGAAVQLPGPPPAPGEGAVEISPSGALAFVSQANAAVVLDLEGLAPTIVGSVAIDRPLDFAFVDPVTVVVATKTAGLARLAFNRSPLRLIDEAFAGVEAFGGWTLGWPSEPTAGRYLLHPAFPSAPSPAPIRFDAGLSRPWIVDCLSQPSPTGEYRCVGQDSNQAALTHVAISGLPANQTVSNGERADRRSRVGTSRAVRPSSPIQVVSQVVALRDFPLTERLAAPEDLALSSSGVLLATFPFQSKIIAFRVDVGPVCESSATRACLRDGRFAVDIDWRDAAGSSGQGAVVPGGSNDSQLFTFFDPANWELLVKVLDGCSFTGHFWVFAAATTDLEYTMRVTDVTTGAFRDYANPLGVAADAITDTLALPCDPGNAGLPTRSLGSRQLASAGPTRTRTERRAAVCADTGSELCLNQNRFDVEVSWRDFDSNTGSGQVVPLRSADSGLFWFFDADNWEMLVKVLDACAFNANFWVFAAATTNVEYTLRVTDTETGAVREYENPLGRAAPALTDTRAFACGS